MSIEEVPISFRDKKEFIDEIDQVCEKRGIQRSEFIREALRQRLYGVAWPLEEARRKMLESTEALMSSFKSIEQAGAKLGALGKEAKVNGE